MSNGCGWETGSELMIKYHDEEWGVPVHDDKKHFEYIILDAFQAGLSWSTVLNKRQNFRKAFDNFDFNKIAKYDENKIQELLNDSGIIRNKLKIAATIENAKQFIRIREEFGTFDKFIWGIIGNKRIINNWKTISELPAKSDLSDKMSKELLKRGFKFVGSTICYAYMQAAGMVLDHIANCHRYNLIKKMK